MSQYGFLFDLDGVIVDTAKYHFLAWKRLADELGIPFTEQDNERLKGVSRMASLEIILEIGNRTMTEDEKQALCQRKNDWYVEYIKKLEKSELLPGVENFLKQARAAGIKIALGSASKNSPLILDRLGITELFDAVVDGTRVSRAKPDPEVFVTGAEDLGIETATGAVVISPSSTPAALSRRTITRFCSSCAFRQRLRSRMRMSLF